MAAEDNEAMSNKYPASASGNRGASTLCTQQLVIKT